MQECVRDFAADMLQQYQTIQPGRIYAGLVFLLRLLQPVVTTHGAAQLFCLPMHQ